ncbi:hypothetical protein FHS27_004550 [Rhodopirellula rubra]|uniref:Uncharacterized protein n=1 Tax=Aporhodopirellula rubra TaxID=980271 RepID=A0A7W5H7T1_9BACT|nr:MARVEL domain-containing protein [Aporhodopirellula rubra]MBB3208718.1 hypothetical protein [Aporhodopirellula rubra]
MLHSRRQDDRRRRVLMTSASVSAASPTSGSRSRMEQLREARRPTLAYGSRVRKCLRGRWFSLVPIQRTTVAKVFSVLSLIVLVLILLNDATARFVTFADRPSFVRVFRISEYGSIGRYFIGVMYLALAGAGWMVYQLRRFRNDDFGGNYRVWQWIVGLALLSSVAHVVPILGMLGGTIEWIMGKRIALSGKDWIGLFLIIGGAILAMRSVAEMRRYRASVSLLVVGWLWSAIPISVDWNILATTTNLRWTVVTSSHLLAVSFWFAATVTYLRSLYFEVRGIEPSAGLVQRMTDAFARRSTAESNDSDTTDDTTDSPARKTTAKPAAAKVAAKPAATKTRPPKPTRDESDESDDQDEAAEKKPNSGKRRWFGLLGPAKPKAEKRQTDEEDSEDTDSGSGKSSDDDGESRPPEPKRQIAAKTTPKPATPPESDDDDASAEDGEPKKKRSWFPSLRRKPKPPADEDESAAADEKQTAAKATPAPAKAAEPEPESDAESTEAPKKRRFGLGSMMRRKPKADADLDKDAEESANTDSSGASKSPSNQPTPNRAAANANAAASDDSNEDDDDSAAMPEDDVDWSSMNKAERRRMRKQLKRGGRAA